MVTGKTYAELKKIVERGREAQAELERRALENWNLWEKKMRKTIDEITEKDIWNKKENSNLLNIS